MGKTSKLELIYVPDENAFYFKRYSDWKVSQVFKTLREAREAYRQGEIKWR